MRTLLVADPTAELEPWVKAIASELRARVTHARTGDALEATLMTDGPFDLVVTDAQLQGKSGLQVLARARSLKLRVPFIVVTSVHAHLARVMVSDSITQTLTSRMVDRANLAALARGLVMDSSRPVAGSQAHP